jgi:hypothetical protein
LGPGAQWQLLDGDANIYSAVWLHMSDVDAKGLPGTAQTLACQYAETRQAWYSVTFSGGNGDHESTATPTPSPTPTPGATTVLIQAEDFEATASTNVSKEGTHAKGWKDSELVYDFHVGQKAYYVIELRMILKENIIAVEVDGDRKYRAEIPKHGQLLGNPYNLRDWSTWEAGIGELAAGSHTLKVVVGSDRHEGQEFDWFRISKPSGQPARLNVTYHEQEKDMSCYAAVAHSLILDYGGTNISEFDFSKDTFGQVRGRLYYDQTGLPDLLGEYDKYEKGLEKHSGLQLVRDDDITWDEVTSAIDGGYPIVASLKMDYFMPGASGYHAVLIVGYEKRNSSTWQKIYILNPSKSSGSPYDMDPKFGTSTHYLYQHDLRDDLHAAWRVDA